MDAIPRRERLRPLVTTTARRQRGAGTLEYLGIVMIVACLLSTMIGAGPQLGRQLTYTICQVMQKAAHKIGTDTGVLCAAALAKNLPQCLTYRQDRLLGVDGEFDFIRADIDGKDQIYTTIDPVTGQEKSYVILANGGDVGVGAKAGKTFSAGGGKLEASAKAVIGGSAGVVYTFDSQKEAQDFLDERRGNIVKRGLGVLTGGVADGLFDTGRKIFHGIFGGGGHDPVPSGGTVDLMVQAEGGVNGELGKDGLPIKGKVELGVEGQEAGQFRYNTDGTSQLSVTWSGSATGEAGIGGSKNAKYLSKLGLAGGGSASGSVGYRVNFDKDGNPTTLTLTTEHGTEAFGKASVGDASGQAGGGKLVMDTYTLDLTTPEGKKAFQDALPTLVSGPINPVSPIELFATDNPLSRELYGNAVQMEQTYDTTGNQVGADAPHEDKEEGVHEGGFGLGFNDETSRRTLTGAKIRAPGGDWENLTKCSK